VARILRWDRPARDIGPCLIIPFRQLDGTFNGFCRVKPDRPRTEERDGKIRHIKYEQPRGKSSKAYFTLAAIEAIKSKGTLLGFTEGEKKALAISQAGIPCIGLTGIWNWQRPRVAVAGTPKGERKLIEDLAAIDWAGRIVPIIFDTDSDRNPDVDFAAAELARVLSELGAEP
jgi:hypothetical protein